MLSSAFAGHSWSYGCLSPSLGTTSSNLSRSFPNLRHIAHAVALPILFLWPCASIHPCSLRLLLALAGNNLDSLSLDVVRVVQLELDVLDNEGPDLVAEAVGVEMSL